MRWTRRETPFGAPSWHDEVDRGPIDAEIERRRGDDGAQASCCHRCLDLPALLDGKAAMMLPDRQIVVVEAPQLVKREFGLGPRIDEDQRRAVRLDHVVDIRQGMQRHMAGPGQVLLGHENRDLGFRSRGT